VYSIDVISNSYHSDSFELNFYVVFIPVKAHVACFLAPTNPLDLR